jgi:hypothetical protein
MMGPDVPQAVQTGLCLRSQSRGRPLAPVLDPEGCGQGVSSACLCEIAVVSCLKFGV